MVYKVHIAKVNCSDGYKKGSLDSEQQEDDSASWNSCHTYMSLHLGYGGPLAVLQHSVGVKEGNLPPNQWCSFLMPT